MRKLLIFYVSLLLLTSCDQLEVFDLWDNPQGVIYAPNGNFSVRYKFVSYQSHCYFDILFPEDGIWQIRGNGNAHIILAGINISCFTDKATGKYKCYNIYFKKGLRYNFILSDEGDIVNGNSVDFYKQGKDAPISDLPAPQRIFVE
jgi:hypothetical protein